MTVIRKGIVTTQDRSNTVFDQRVQKKETLNQSPRVDFT